MGIDSASGSLATNVAGEGDAHTPTWRLGEEGPREGRDLLRTRSVLGSGGNRGTLHTRPGRPTPDGRRAQNQSHRLILLFISQKQNPYLPILRPSNLKIKNRMNIKQLPWTECDC